MGHTVEQKCCDSGTFWLYLFMIMGLLLFSGLMSGLTLGLMSLGMVDLEVIKKSGKPEDRKHAEKIVPVVRRQHLLLVTLLVGNAMAMEALPLFLDSLVDTWMAIVLSVTLLLMFGEILPQAVCSRYGLAVGAAMAPIVRLLLFIMFPIAWPVSKLLDKLLGADRHNGLFGRAELKTLVDMHSNEAGNGGNLSSHETRIIAGALELADKTARHVMSPIPAIISVEVNSKLDDAAMMSILSSGFSRIPVYSGKPENIIGLIVVKNLLNVTIESRSKLPVIDVPIRRIPWIPENMPLYEVLHEFQQGRSHMAAVIRSASVNSSFAENEASCIDVGVDADACTNLEDVNAQADFGSAEQISGPDHDLERPSAASKNSNVEGVDKATEKATQSRTQLSSVDSSEASLNSNINAQQDSEDNKNSREYYRLVSWTDEEFKGNILGIITREDVLDELLKEEVPPNLVSNDCAIQAVDQEFTQVSMRELEASLHKNADFDHYKEDSMSKNFTAAAQNTQNALQASPLSSTRGDCRAGACVSAERTPCLSSPTKIGRNHHRKSTSLHRQHSIAVLESSDSASPRHSCTGTAEKAVVDSWRLDQKRSPLPESHSPSQAAKSSSVPNSPSPTNVWKSAVGSQSMNSRTHYVPRSRIAGITPFRNFISRAFMHGGQESPISMSRQLTVQTAFQNDEE